MPPTTPRAVELIRVSTSAQAERDTPELQRRALDALRQHRPCTLVERIEALGVSGALAEQDRADLQRLAVLSGQQAYDELRVYRVDRLTRADDPRDRIAIFGYAIDAGATIVDCAGRVIDPKDEMGEVDFFLQTLFSARERRKILERTMAGRRRCAEAGTLCHGQAPYGRRYDREAGWVEVPEQLEVYRRIVAEVISGRSTREVAAGLTRDAIPPTRGEVWRHSTIKRLLRTETILGRYSVCGSTTEIPPVVDEVTWARARAALEGRSSCSTRPTRPALLRGLLRCGACGCRASVESDGAGSVARYGCPHPAKRPVGSAPCPARRTVRVPMADAAVRAALLEALTTPDVLRAAVVRPERPPADALGQAERTAATLRRQESHVLRLLADGVLSEDVGRERLSQLRTARGAAEDARQRALLAAADAPGVGSDAHVEAAALELGEAVREASDERWRELLGLLAPDRAPYGMRLGSGGIVVSARLPLAGLAGHLATPTARSGQGAGVVLVRLLVAC